MLLNLVYTLVRFLLEILLISTASEARFRAEVLALATSCETSSARPSGRLGSHRTGFS